MPDEGASVLAHDETPPGLFDDRAATGFYPLATLRPQLIDVANIAHSGLPLLQALGLSLLAALRQRAARCDLSRLLTLRGLLALCRLLTWRGLLTGRRLAALLARS